MDYIDFIRTSDEPSLKHGKGELLITTDRLNLSEAECYDIDDFLENFANTIIGSSEEVSLDLNFKGGSDSGLGLGSNTENNNLEMIQDICPNDDSNNENVENLKMIEEIGPHDNLDNLDNLEMVEEMVEEMAEEIQDVSEIIGGADKNKNKKTTKKTTKKTSNKDKKKKTSTKKDKTLNDFEDVLSSDDDIPMVEDVEDSEDDLNNSMIDEVLEENEIVKQRSYQSNKNLMNETIKQTDKSNEIPEYKKKGVIEINESDNTYKDINELYNMYKRLLQD